VSGLTIVGVGPGLGTRVARRFAREGLGVSLVARCSTTLSAVASALSPYDVPVTACPADAGRREQLQAALASAVVGRGPVRRVH
jgi:short-subunit dehydrogenase